MDDPFYAVGLPIAVSDHGQSIEAVFATPPAARRRGSAGAVVTRLGACCARATHRHTWGAGGPA